MCIYLTNVAEPSLSLPYAHTCLHTNIHTCTHLPYKMWASALHLFHMHIHACIQTYIQDVNAVNVVAGRKDKKKYQSQIDAHSYLTKCG